MRSDPIVAEVRELADKWAEAAGIELGGEPTVHEFDVAIAKSMVASA